jgi:hypothetical protein
LRGLRLTTLANQRVPSLQVERILVNVRSVAPRFGILGHGGPELVAKLGYTVAAIVVSVGGCIARPPDQAAIS